MKAPAQSTLLQSRPTQMVRRQPALVCAQLPRFDSSDLAAIHRAFQNAAWCELRQSWRAEADARFAPGLVRVGRRDDALHVFAELSDADIFNDATHAEERVWERGDTFEIFLQAAGQEAYVELHVTPQNRRLALRYESTAIVEQVRGNGLFADALLPGDSFRSTAWIEPMGERWFVHGIIPFALVCEGGGPLAGRPWRFSFSRYDYTRGQSEPVLSSTSLHAELDFHRRGEWGVLVLQESSTTDERGFQTSP